jgi:hypothetical protein
MYRCAQRTRRSNRCTYERIITGAMKKETGQEYYARHTCRKYKNITGPLQGTGVGYCGKPKGPRTSQGDPWGPSYSQQPAVLLFVLHDLGHRVIARGALVGAAVVIWAIRFNASKPHLCAALGAPRSCDIEFFLNIHTQPPTGGSAGASLSRRRLGRAAVGDDGNIIGQA